MIDIIGLLKENNQVSDFRVKWLLTDSYEAFYVHKKVEALRAVTAEECSVTVYVDHEKGKGESSFSLYDSTTVEQAKRKIELSVERAKMICNNPYQIPAGDTAFYEVESNMNKYEMNDLCDKIASAVFKANTFEHGSLNAVEVFVTKRKENIVNCKGVNKTQITYSAMVEAIPTWTEGGESVELYENYRFTHFDEAEVIKEIEGKMVEVRDRRIAKKPTVPMSCPVVIGGNEISSLLDELCSQLNYASVYSHANVHSVGDKLQENPVGDKLTVTMKGEIEGSPFSSKFDDDGLTLIDKTIVEDGVVKGYFGSNRFGQYLGEKEITGNLYCMSLNLGNATKASLNGKQYVELISLSGLQLDLYNDYIGGEVRLAYLYNENGEATPITGISISGSLKEALNGIILSNKKTVKGAYEGPDFAILSGLTVI